MRYDIDIYSNNLLLPEVEMRHNGVSEQVIQRILRLRDVYNYMLRNPLKKDREYVDYIQANYQTGNKPLSKQKAYEDLEILHAIVGSLQMCTKEWHRWRFNHMIMEGYAIALRRQDAVAIARLAGQYGKYNQLDKNDDRDNGLHQVPHIIFVTDPTSLGFRPIPNVYQVIDKLTAQYTGTPLEHIVEDADAVEIANEPLSHSVNGNTGTIPE